jgi:large subunit ribosomal protein L13
MKNTYMAKKQDVVKKWYIVDAQDKILGRLASRVAAVLKGKHKPMYTPHIDTGDGVIVLNSAKIKTTGRKMEDKLYRKHSGYPGGFKEVNLKTMLAKRPNTVIRLAVRRMLPQGPLARKCIKKLRIYSDDKHPHKGQSPITLEV